MPKDLKQLSKDAYCSAPPLQTSVRRPRLSRDVEARRPRAPIIEVKREVMSSIESVEFVADDNDKPDVKYGIPFNPRQIGDPLQASLGASAIWPSSSTSSVNQGAAATPGPSRYQELWGIGGKAKAASLTWVRPTRQEDEGARKAQSHGLGWLSQ